MTGPIRSSTGERMHDAFVESPTRSNKTAVEVLVGNPGDISSGSTNTTAVVSNINLATANVENSIALPSNCKGFIFKPRTVARIYLAYVSGGPYFYVGLGAGFTDTNKYNSQNIYLYSDKNNTDIDLITYT